MNHLDSVKKNEETPAILGIFFLLFAGFLALMFYEMAFGNTAKAHEEFLSYKDLYVMFFSLLAIFSVFSGRACEYCYDKGRKDGAKSARGDKI